MIESLEADRKAQVENLDSLYTLLVEKRMWYTGLEESNKTFRVTGIALDNYTVADYMTRVEKSDRFDSVKLASVKQHAMKEKNVKLKKFEINFRNKAKQPKATEGKK